MRRGTMHSFFQSLSMIPLSAKKHGAHLVNLYSESRKRNVERNRKMDGMLE